jgi:hypothetical protein
MAARLEDEFLAYYITPLGMSELMEWKEDQRRALENEADFDEEDEAYEDYCEMMRRS